MNTRIQTRSGRLGKEFNLLPPLPEIKSLLVRPTRSLVAKATDLSRIQNIYLYFQKCNKKDCRKKWGEYFGPTLAKRSGLGNGCTSHTIIYFNPLNKKRRLLYLKTQFVPRSKHFSSLL